MSASHSQPRNLPPGVDQQPIFGSMWIRIGTLKLIRTSNAQYQVSCQFWGEQNPAILQTRSDFSNNQNQRIQHYNIRCPVTFFAEYIQEMQNNFKLTVEDVGKVNIDISKFLSKKKQVTIDSRQAFQHFNGFFQVIGKGNRKAGSLEVQMGTNFDPEVAYRELGEEGVQQLRQSAIKSCPYNNATSKDGCDGSCPCHTQKVHCLASKKKQNLTKQVVQNNDKRIANSLDIEQRPQQQFDPQRYIEKQEEKIVKNKKQQKKVAKQQIKQKSKQQKLEQVKRENVQKDQEGEQFPQIPQVLTYSGLRLDYQTNDKPIQQSKQSQSQQNKQRQIEQSERIQVINRQPLAISSGRNQAQQKLQKVQTPLNKITDSVEDSSHLFKNTDQNKDLFRQFYQGHGQPNKNQVIQPNQQKSPQILSRVVNLNEQMFNQSEIMKPMHRPPVLSYDNITKPGGQGPTFRKIPEGNYPARPQNHIKATRTGSSAFRKQGTTILLLNLLVEINTCSIKFLDSKNKFTIVYRPYGSKQRITTGPTFGDIITILCPVGEDQIKKMDKTPFILEFWDVVIGKFLGILKINLKKIKKGFLLNNRLNQIAIKTNILPTVIHRGQAQIKDISDTKTGQCSIYTAIGTSSQLNSYLNDTTKKFNNETHLQNQRRNNIHQTPEKDNKEIPANKSSSKQKIRNKQLIFSDNILQDIDMFFGELDAHSNEIISKLLLLSKKQSITYPQFVDTFSQCKQQKQIYNFLQQFNHESGVNFKELSASFDDYKETMRQIYQIFRINSKKLKESLGGRKQQKHILQKAKQLSSFYTLNKQKLSQILIKSSNSPKTVQNYLQIFNNIINLDYLQSSLSTESTKYPHISSIQHKFLNQTVSKIFYKKLKTKQINADTMLRDLQQKSAGISIQNLIDYASKQNIYTSLWTVLHLYQNIKEQFQLDDIKIGGSIPLSSIYNWYVSMMKRNISESSLENDKSVSKEIQQKNKRKVDVIQKQDDSIDKFSKKQEQQSQRKPEPIQQKNKQSVAVVDNSDLSKQKSQNKQVINVLPQDSIQKQNKPNNIPVEQAQKSIIPIYRHLFSIEPVQIHLQSPLKGNCQVSYTFPFQQQQIKSKTFVSMADKYRYPLKMYGTHGFSIQDSPQNYLGDNVVKFVIRIDGRIQYEGALHTDQLLIEPNSHDTKVIPLFNDRIEGMAGKLKLQLQYEKGVNNENTLGKQTTYQLFLPKNGYINYSITSQIDIMKIKNYLSIHQQFYISLVFDLFHLAPNLKTLFPIISSKLYPCISQQIELEGSIKINLSSLILEYIKQKTAKISLNIIFYAKQRANFERKQITYATIQLPLINILKNQGIAGDYAFKNKLGMFVTLAKCQMQYQKDAKNKIQAKKQTDKNKQLYWVLLNFLEFMNFQGSAESLSWIKFEYVMKGKKYATQKAYLQHDAINPLRNSSIVMHFSQEDFHDFKVIPITIYTNSSERYAIDINMKSLGRQLLHQKYSINNQYFLVVNQSSEPMKMRVGLKIYTIRGSPSLSNFIDSLSHNLDTQIFNQLTLPQQISQYQKMLNIFKRNLKLSTRTLDQACHQLLINKKSDKLSLDFFTNRTYYKLDFTPIIAHIDSHIQFICEELPTQVDSREIVGYIKENNIGLMNFREEFLYRFTFKELNRYRIDKNVQFFGMQDKVDLMAFIRKIKISDPNNSDQNQHYPYSQTMDNNQNQSNYSAQYRQLLMTVLQGNNFHQLYNGIKPNAMIRIPDLGFETQIISRNSNPYFNQVFSSLLQSEMLNNYKRLKVEVYHCSTDAHQSENILIGEGMVTVPFAELKYGQPNNPKIVKVTLNSMMSAAQKMKATLNLKFSMNQITNSKLNPDQSSHNYQRQLLQGDDSKWQSRDASRMGNIIHDIKTEMKYKKDLFDFSDDDY